MARQHIESQDMYRGKAQRQNKSVVFQDLPDRIKELC